LASIPLIVAYVAGQENSVIPQRAVWYAGAFSLGLFISIAVVGIICALLGRMLGDVGIWWQVLVGAVLIWVALAMLGVQACSMSGSCTFGFIAPILAIVSVQLKIVTGAVMLVLFALGHCLPIVAAGLTVELTEIKAEKG
jgi:cytochrome c-type biogenesis protein